MIISIKSIHRIFFLFSLFFFYGSLLFSQGFGIPDVVSFDRRQYNAAAQNWKISQSNHDQIYIANSSGLMEYNGETWALYNKMGDEKVRCVKCIGEFIYAGTINDFGYFEYDSLHHLSYQSFAVTPELRGLGDVWHIFSWNNYVVFQMTLGMVFVVDNKVDYVMHTNFRFFSSFLAAGRLFVYEEQVGLKEVLGHATHLVSEGDFFAHKYVTSVIAIPDQKFVITTIKDGAFVWDMETLQPWNSEIQELFIAANISCGQRYNKDKIIFGTNQQGVFVTDNDGQLLLHIDQDKGLGNNSVNDVFVDREGSVWCALENGVSQIKLNANVSFLTGFYNLGTGSDITRFDDFWFLGTNQALFKISNSDMKSPLKDRHLFTVIQGTEGKVWSLFSDQNQLLCGHNEGVINVVGDKGTIITPPSVKGGLIFKRVEKDPDLLVCGTYSGVISFIKKNQRWQFYKEYKKYYFSTHYLEQGKNGYWWASDGKNSVFRILFAGNYAEIREVIEYDGKYFDDGDHLVVSKINDQVIIIGSKGIFAIKEGTIFQRFDYLAPFIKGGSVPKNIKQDRYHNLWFFYKEKIEVLRYLEDGTYKSIEAPFIPLKNRLAYGPEFVYAPDKSNTFFGVDDGFAHYNPGDVDNFRFPFKVHLRFRGVEDSLDYVLLQGDKGRFKQRVVPAYPFKDNRFELNYFASFFGDQDLEYSSFLSNVDNGFTSWTKSTSRQFFNLKEGNYIFKVKARNGYGVESESLVFNFKVLPPWYRSIYFRIAFVLIIVWFVSLVVLKLSKRIELIHQKEQLKQQEKYSRMKEKLTLEAERAEREMVKLRNEKLKGEMVYKEKELANLTVNIVQKNEFLGEVKEQLKKVKSTNKTTSNVNRQIDFIIKQIDNGIDNENYWDLFEVHIEQVHADFLKRLINIHPDLTSKERKICAYIRMGMTSKEIAALLNITAKSVDNLRSNLRKSLKIDSNVNLFEYIDKI